MQSNRVLRVIKAAWSIDSVRAAVVLIFVQHVCFFPCIWGNKTLLESAREAPSILWQGAWAGSLQPQSTFNKVSDPGAPAWQNEPWFALIRYQYFSENVLPLWNPYQAYGAPLAANMQSQPFFPLTLLLSLHLSPRSYNWYILSRLFIAGFFCYLYLRLFLSFFPALAGGVTSMLAGYYILFLTIPELSLAVLLPAGLFAGELLLRKTNYGSLVWFAALILLIFLGGGPETALLLLSFLYLYLIVRIASDPDLRAAWKHAAKWLALATIAGIGLSLFVILPFLAYLPHSWNNHEPRLLGGAFRGLQHDVRNVSIFTYLFPLLLGPVNNPVLPNTLSALRNYFGVISLYYVFIAVTVACRPPFRRDRRLLACTLFFFVSILFVILKRYGILINFAGRFPIFRLLDFAKYDELLLSISVSILAAFGVEHLVKRKASSFVQCLALALTFLFIPLAVIRSGRVLKKELFIDHLNPAMPLLSVGLPVILLIALAISLIWFNQIGANSRCVRMGMICVVLLAIEFSFNYLIPVYYAFNKLPDRASSPYQGAPFIDFLKAQCGVKYRIIGQEGDLTPNWAAAFQLLDVRCLDALYVARYFPFLENFFPDWQSHSPELSQCFKGFGNFDFTNPFTQRLLQLSSVKYLLANRFFVPPDNTIQKILLQNRGHLAPGHESQISSQSFNLGGTVRGTLGEHPPYSDLSYRLTVPNGTGDFHFAYGIDSAAYDKGGDGVDFAIKVKDKTGEVRQVFSNYIDPKHDVKERHWMEGNIDLKAYQGQAVELLLSTGPGPKGDTSYDWAGWSDFHFGSEEPSPTSPFRPVYDHEVKISEYDDILPRATIYYHADLEQNDSDVLHRLADPSLDVFRSVVLNKASLDDDEIRAISEINRKAAKLVGEAKILSYRSQTVVIQASPTTPAILMLNDTAFPGWTVLVDNMPARILTTDYFFRGVLLKPGSHVIRFTYRPLPFYLGSSISGATLLVLAGAGLLNSKRVRMHSGNVRYLPPHLPAVDLD